jgi:hypothetical protein
MRTLAALLTLLACAGGHGALAQDEQAKKIDAQKKAATAAWQSLDCGESAFSETKHLLIVAPKTMQPRLKAIGTLLENYHAQAAKAAGLDLKEGYPGKITIYLLPGKDEMTAFARRVEKRRPLTGEMGSFQADDDRLHAAAYPAASKPPVAVEARAGEMLAALILKRRAGRGAQLPDWLTTGFGRATSYQVSPRDKFVQEERKVARVLVRKRSASDVWGGTLEPDEAGPLQASLSEFMGYGPGKKYFGKFVEGFRPGENVTMKTTAQALEEARLTTAKVNNAWKNWVR